MTRSFMRDVSRTLRPVALTIARVPLWIAAWPFILALWLSVTYDVDSDVPKMVGALGTFGWLTTLLLAARTAG